MKPRLVLVLILVALGALPACGGGGEPDPQAFCEGWAELPEVAAQADTDAGAEAVQDLVDTAPDAIAGDVEVVEDVYEDAAENADAVTAEAEAAQTRIVEWVGDNC